ncbi:MAG TPA: TonB-dependent receptor [Rhizomicrobium sp.]|jgi:outer membrane receptor protein involved in Fe transport|nr:TonB-dependent receptor [Rhizomicrobium sp.]
MKRIITTLLLGTAAVPALYGQASAADNQSIETVIVTAEKRPESLKDVPMGITAIGGDVLDKLGARDFETYVATVPGLNLIEASPSKPQLVLRGVNAGGDGATIGTYVDETPYGSSSALVNGLNMAPNIDTFDMSRIEVLRGPQGTLYGANTLGGLLKFVTNAPDTSSLEAKAELGGTAVDNGGGGYFVRGMLNVPLTDDLAVRIVANDSFDPGYIDDPGRGLKNLNGVRRKGGRVSVLYRPDDKITIRLSAVNQALIAGNDASVDILDPATTGGKIVPLYGAYEQQRTANGTDISRYAVYNATVDWDLDFATLTSSTSYSSFHSYQLTDGTGALGVDIDAFAHLGKFTQELRLASDPNGGPIDWLAGLYYTNETGGILQNLVLAPRNPPFMGLNLLLNSGYSEVAGFGDLTWHISPDLDVTLGGRYSGNSQHAVESGLAAEVGASTGDVFTWSAAADYKVTDAISAYARVAKGYRPGGPNVLPIAGAPGAPASYSADSLINYETGVKGGLFDGTVSFDFDAFYIDWSDIQLLTVIASTGVDINGGGARSMGFEWDTNWRPLENLSLGFSGAYVDAALTADTPALVGGLKGDALPFSPKWSFTFDGDYHIPLDGDFKPYIGGLVHYIGSRASDFQAGSSQVTLPSYTDLEARVGIDWDNWEAELYGKNLSDAKGYTYYSSSGTSLASGNAPSVSVITPRTFGLVLRVKF